VTPPLPYPGLLTYRGLRLALVRGDPRVRTSLSTQHALCSARVAICVNSAMIVQPVRPGQAGLLRNWGSRPTPPVQTIGTLRVGQCTESLYRAVSTTFANVLAEHIREELMEGTGRGRVEHG
jgi:hypothetical protein